jgi:sulfofructose kinase
LNSFQAVCVGVITMDTIALVDKYPSADERVIAHQISRGGGGPAAVAAVALARLGIETAIVGTIGKDSDALEILNIFQREGVNTSGIAISDGPTAGSVIVASREHSTRAINTRQPMTQAPLTSSAKSLRARAQWIHCDHVGITRLEEMGIARGKGPKISFDAGYGVEKFDSSLVDLFVPTDRMIALRHPGLSLEAGVTSDAKTASNICVATRGPDGSVAYSEATGYVSAKGFSVDVLSTLGAGDVFHGALLAQIIQERPLQEALLRANAVAAISCLGLDGQSAIPHTDELNSFLEANA